MEYELVKALEDLIAFERIRGIYKSIAEMSNRKVDDLARGVYNRVASKERLPHYSEVATHVETEKEMKKVRKMEEAIKIFSQEYPKAYKRLIYLIGEEREKSEIYLHFGYKEGCELTKEAYFRIFRNLGIKEKDLQDVYHVTEETLSLLRKKPLNGDFLKHIDLDKKKTKKNV